MKTGKSIVELAQELQNRAALKEDFVAESKSIYVQSDARHIELADRSFDLTQHAQRQITSWAGIPAKYADQCIASDPALLAINMNHWLRSSLEKNGTPTRRMVRTLGGDARAFLSDRYRRIDNEDIAEAVLPILLNEPGLQIISSEVTESRLYLKALLPRIEADIAVGDTVQAGLMISNSEIGAGSLQVKPLVYRLVCSNGMIADRGGMSRYHVGRRVAGDGDDIEKLFRDETIAADDHALMLKVQDVVRASLDAAVFSSLVDDMRAATEGPQILRPAKAVEVLGKTLGLQQSEQDSVLESLIRGGDYSRWGALNAVTAIANTHESYDRATELETLGGKVLDLDPSQWQQVAEAA